MCSWWLKLKPLRHHWCHATFSEWLCYSHNSTLTLSQLNQYSSPFLFRWCWFTKTTTTTTTVRYAKFVRTTPNKLADTSRSAVSNSSLCDYSRSAVAPSRSRLRTTRSKLASVNSKSHTQNARWGCLIESTRVRPFGWQRTLVVGAAVYDSTTLCSTTGWPDCAFKWWALQPSAMPKAQIVCTGNEARSQSLARSLVRSFHRRKASVCLGDEHSITTTYWLRPGPLHKGLREVVDARHHNVYLGPRHRRSWPS